MAQLNEGLIGAWAQGASLPIGDGCALDESVNGNTLSMDQGAVTTDRTAFEFNGSETAYLYASGGPDKADPADFGSQPFSFYAEVFLAVDQGQYVVSYETNTGTNTFSIFYHAGNNYFTAVLTNSSETQAVVNSQTVTTGAWYNIFLRYDGAQIRFRVNAVDATNVPLAGPLRAKVDGTQVFRLGVSGSTGTGWQDKIRRVFLWAKHLSASEVTAVEAGWTPNGWPRGAINVALLLGQSNTNGQENYAGLWANNRIVGDQMSLVADGRANLTRTRYFHAMNATAGEDSTDMGAEVGLAQVLGPNWAVIKYGVGGSSLHTDWQTGGTSWTGASAHITEMLQELVRLGFTIGDVAVVHIAGEEEAKSAAEHNNFAAHWETFRANIEGIVGKPIYAVLSRLWGRSSKPDRLRLRD